MSKQSVIRFLVFCMPADVRKLRHSGQSTLHISWWPMLEYGHRILASLPRRWLRLASEANVLSLGMYTKPWQVGPGGTGHWWITCQVSKLGAPQRLGQLSTANCSYLHYILLILHIEHRGARSCAQCFVNTSARRLEESLAQVLPLALLSYKFYTSIGAVYGSLWQFVAVWHYLPISWPKYPTYTKIEGNSAISATL